MKLSAREDIDVPQDRAFQTLARFEHWERAALRGGASVTRTDRLAAAGPGMAWQVGFAWRGKPRSLSIRLTDFDAPQGMRFEGMSPSLQGWMTIDVVRMGPRRTRLVVTLEVKPRTLASRLFLQSLRLARGRVVKRLQTSVEQLGQAIVKHQPRD